MPEVSYRFPQDQFPQCYWANRQMVEQWMRDNVGQEGVDWGVNGYWFNSMHYWIANQERVLLFVLRWS